MTGEKLFDFDRIFIQMIALNPKKSIHSRVSRYPARKVKLQLPVGGALSPMVPIGNRFASTFCCLSHNSFYATASTEIDSRIDRR